jgi:hypothetical protein
LRGLLHFRNRVGVAADPSVVDRALEVGIGEPAALCRRSDALGAEGRLRGAGRGAAVVMLDPRVFEQIVGCGHELVLLDADEAFQRRAIQRGRDTLIMLFEPRGRLRKVSQRPLGLRARAAVDALVRRDGIRCILDAGNRVEAVALWRQIAGIGRRGASSLSQRSILWKVIIYRLCGTRFGVDGYAWPGLVHRRNRGVALGRRQKSMGAPKQPHEQSGRCDVARAFLPCAGFLSPVERCFGCRGR